MNAALSSIILYPSWLLMQQPTKKQPQIVIMTGKQQPNRILFPLLLGSLFMVTLITFIQSRHIVLPSHEGGIDHVLESFRRETSLQETKSGEDTQEPMPSTTQDLEKSIENIGPLPSGYDTFSACLLVMDDNHRLPEWLAYHYHVLPLRYLIIAVDPRSCTSPKHILNQWRTMGMHIQEWNDHEFLNPTLAANIIPDDAPLQNKRDRHRSRQKNFYRSCLSAMKQRNRTYTMLIDTDEFLMYNHAGGDKATWDAWERRQLERHQKSAFAAKKRIRPSTVTPSPGEEGSMMKYIRREKEAGHVSLQTPCISVPRLQFGAVDSTEAERSHKVPPKFNPERFDTLRFRKHAHRNDFVKNGLSKCIIDVSLVDIEQTPKFESLHRPIKTICGAPWVDEWKTLLRIHHFLGSWESYSFRNDARRGGERSREGWEFRASDSEETDDLIRPWFSSFVQRHGHDKAQDLLKYAGLPKTYKNPNETAWTIMFLKEILGRNESVQGNDSRRSFDGFVRKRYGLDP